MADEQDSLAIDAEEKWTSVNVRMPAELLERVDEQCKLRVVGRPLIFAKAIEYYLAQLPPVNLPEADPKAAWSTSLQPDTGGTLAPPA